MGLLFKPVVKRDPKTGEWVVASNSMRGMKDALRECEIKNELDAEIAEKRGVTIHNYRQAKLRYERGE